MMAPQLKAASITFSNFEHLGSDAIDYIIVIEDDNEAGVSSGMFKISYQVDPLSALTTEKLTGFFLDVEDSFAATSGPYNAGNLNLSNQTVASCGQAFNTNAVVAGGGCNTNLTLGAGAGAFQGHDWDLAIAWKNNNDLSDGLVQSFEIADLGYDISDIVAIGIRAQATTGAGGSAKEFQVGGNEVPLPASTWLFGSALALLTFIKRRL